MTEARTSATLANEGVDPLRPLRVGFIGLGDQGEPMAECLAQSSRCQLFVHARRPTQAESVLAAGAHWAASIGELAGGSDVLSICVSDDAAVRDVVRVALPALGAGAVIVIHSTIAPETCRALEADARALGVDVVDAPVSGGAQRARDGRLTIFVGGEASVVERVRPAIEPFAGAIFHVGSVGAGQTLKLVNNYLFAAHREIAQQATSVLTALGLDVRTSASAIALSTGASECMRRVADAGDGRGLARHGGGHTRGHALLAKDVGLFRQQVQGSTGFSADVDALVDSGLRWASGGAPAPLRPPDGCDRQPTSPDSPI